MVSHIQQTLDNVSLLNRYHKQVLDTSVDTFNIFKVCGVNHYENTHSAILTELLKVDGSHNLKEKFLEAFLLTLKEQRIFDEKFDFSTKNVKVIPEYATKHGRIDIFICNDFQSIILENKIYAIDQFEQLKRYSAFGKEKYNDNFELLYLTLNGNEADEHSGKDVVYKQISYSETIVIWLERCVELAARYPVVRETLIQYINHLKILTGKNMDSTNNEELIKMLSAEKNIESVFLIGDNFNAVKNHIINTVFLPQLTTVCHELGLINISEEGDWATTAYAGFSVRNPNWKYFKIAFEFESRGLRQFITGFTHIDVKVRKEESFNKLRSVMPRKNNNWAWDAFPISYWGKDAMLMIISGEMAGIFKREMEKLLVIADGLDM